MAELNQPPTGQQAQQPDHENALRRERGAVQPITPREIQEQRRLNLDTRHEWLDLLVARDLPCPVRVRCAVFVLALAVKAGQEPGSDENDLVTEKSSRDRIRVEGLVIADTRDCLGRAVVI